MTKVCRNRLNALLVLVVLAALLAASSTICGAVLAQPAARAQLIPGLPEKVMLLPQPLVTRLRTTKAKADLAELQRTYLVRNGVPLIRVVGREYPLLALDKLEYKPTKAQIDASQVLVGPVARYRDLIIKGNVTIPTPPPNVVDRTPQQTAIKDQNPRGTCYAFASIGGLEAAYGGGALDLSENYANYWFMQHEGKQCKADGVGGFDWGSILYSHAVCADSECPYQTAPFPSLCNGGGSPPPARRTAAQSHSVYQITNYSALWRDESVSDSGVYANNPGYLRAALASGREVVVGLFVAGWTDSSMAGIIDVRLGSDGNPLPSTGGHVMLVVGYDQPNEYFIVKNSWGSGSGHAGYLHISYDYMRTYAQLGYVINDVKPLLMHIKTPMLQRLPQLSR
jgi:hypothetical protein